MLTDESPGPVACDKAPQDSASQGPAPRPIVTRAGDKMTAPTSSKTAITRSHTRPQYLRPAAAAPASRIICAAVLSTLLADAVNAAQQNPQQNLFEMSLQQLMEVPVVVSASRQAQKMAELSVPVSVITAEDIHYSGLTSISDILQFAPGVDVIQTSRKRYAVGVRGLHGSISDRVLSLVDGRPADSPIFGGPEFYRLPILPEDIERIEIVRGPGGAAWGANAFTGVINIITKKPEDANRYFASTNISDFGDSFTHLRWADKSGRLAWRISTAYADTKSSYDALDGDSSYQSSQPGLNALMGFDNFKVRDFARQWRLDSKAVYHASEETNVSFGAGYSHLESGDFEVLWYFPRKDNRADLLRSFTRVDHKFASGNIAHLQWSGYFSNDNWPTYGRYKVADNYINGQVNFALGERHQTSIGADLRWTHISTARDTDQQYTYAGSPFDEHQAGLFLIDRWQTTDRLTLEGQIRGDWYEETQTDWAGRLSALYALDEQKRHTLRLSAARAFRTPLIALRKAQGHTVPVLGLYYFNVQPPSDDLDNEQTYSLEAGYTGRLTDNFTLRANTYYQRFSKLIGYRTTTDAFGLYYYTPDNIDGADSWGAELELAVEHKTGKLSVWYAYNDFQEDEGGQSVRSFLPARHKAGLTGRVFFDKGWVFNANYKFTDTTPADPDDTNDVASSHRLDLCISKELGKGIGELMFGVADVLNKDHDPVYQKSDLTSHVVPGRMFFVRIQLRF